MLADSRPPLFGTRKNRRGGRSGAGEAGWRPYDPLGDPGVAKLGRMPAGWRWADVGPELAPAGWRWAHNGLEAAHPGFRFALVKADGGDARETD